MAMRASTASAPRPSQIAAVGGDERDDGVEPADRREAVEHGRGDVGAEKADRQQGHVAVDHLGDEPGPRRGLPPAHREHAQGDAGGEEDERDEATRPREVPLELGRRDDHRAPPETTGWQGPPMVSTWLSSRKRRQVAFTSSITSCPRWRRARDGGCAALRPAPLLPARWSSASWRAPPSRQERSRVLWARRARRARWRRWSPVRSSAPGRRLPARLSLVASWARLRGRWRQQPTPRAARRRRRRRRRSIVSRSRHEPSRGLGPVRRAARR